ncbi:monocarboxylate transporter 13-like [Acanthaster planci]|uniref:Monocarboxylate transporter 13-like n=1 Tax=Acanthaster planci TaxID=133434 RepID=A0A8B7Z6E2_ACAPL|nr:monocarboxylate transporter 13-like [Acanthaster planci]
MAWPRRSYPWRWMILLARFAGLLVCVGTFLSLGIFIPHLVESFSTTTAAAGLICSGSWAFGMIIGGPFVGALLNSCDPRKVTMIGGMLSAITNTAAAASSSITQLAVWFAVSSGGLLFVQIATVKAVAEYFPDNFAVANGVSLAGGMVGMMVFPPVMEFLISLYGWRGALAIMGAVTFHYVVCGALLRPLHHKRAEKYSLVPSRGDSEDVNSKSGQQADGKSRSCQVPTASQNLTESVTEYLDTQLLTEPLFIVYQVVVVLCGIVYTMWHLFLVQRGIELGIMEFQAAFLATFGGLGSLAGRLGHGPLVDSGLVKASTLFAIASLVFAVSCLINILVASWYSALAVNYFVSGMASGVTYSLAYVMVREVTGDHHMSAFGWLFTSLGTGEILGGFIAGWIHDTTGDYGIVVLAIGGLAFIMGVTVTLTRCLISWSGGSDE